jgi:excisionase family DNA binding protein
MAPRVADPAGEKTGRETMMLLDRLFSGSAVQVRRRPRLVDADDNSIELPDEIFDVLRKVVSILKKGDSVSIVPVHQELTTQQAALLLNVSRPHLISLLDANAIPYTKTGKHRRIRYIDLVDYKAERDRKRRAELADLTRRAEEAGEYQ